MRRTPVEQILKLTDGRGVDAAIEALGGGTLASLGVYSGDMKIPLGPFAAGLGDHVIVTTRWLTHRFKLDDIKTAYDLFSHQRDGVLKVAITP